MPIHQPLEEYQGLLRFHVAIGGELVEAFLSRATCQAGDGRPASGAHLLDFYRQHRPAIDGIVRDKVHAGARHPVVVMARDLWRCGPRRAAVNAGPGGANSTPGSSARLN